MTKKEKEKRRKRTNVLAIEVGINKHMRNHPIHGDEYRKQEGFKKLFGPKQRKHRIPGKDEI